MYDFPASPTPGQEYTPPVGGQTYVWQPPRWLVKGIPPAGGGGGGGIDEAPVDGNQYAREDASWSQVIHPATTWVEIPDKPATFPYATPIPQSDVNNLNNDLDSLDGRLATAEANDISHNTAITNLQSKDVSQDTAINGKEPTIAPGTTSQYWRGDKSWQTLPAGIGEAPTDGQQYGRQSSGWSVVTPNPTWATLSGKPATFPPTLPIAESDVTNLVGDLANKAPLASPALTGAPTAPTAVTGTNTTQIATTAFVKANLAALPPAGVTVSDTAPSSPYVGMLWWESDSGNTYVWYDDGTSAQWVMAAPGGGVTDAPNDNTAYSRRYDKWRQDREAPLTAANYFFSSTTNGTGLVAGEARVDTSYGPTVSKVWVHESEMGPEFLQWINHLDYVGPGWFLILEERNYRPNSLILRITGSKVKVGSVYEWACKWIGGQNSLSNGQSLTVSAQPGGAAAAADTRNRLLNPCFQISQENGNTQGTATGYYPADQWMLRHVSSATAPILRTQYAVTPNGSLNRLNVQVVSADTSIASTDYFTVLQRIEGIRVADLRWGTSSAKPVVLRFGFNGPAGTYTAFIQNGAQDKNYLMPFTVTAGQAYTDLTQVFAIPGEQYGTWLKDTGIGMIVGITLASGSSFQGSDNYWNNGAYVGSYSQTNGIGAAANTFDIFDVGLYADPQSAGAPPAWQMPDEAEELRACQRYYAKLTPPPYYLGVVTGVSLMYVPIQFPATMRVNPAAGGFTTTGAVFNPAGSGVTATTYSVTVSNTIAAYISASLNGGMTGLSGNQTIALNARM